METEEKIINAPAKRSKISAFEHYVPLNLLPKDVLCEIAFWLPLGDLPSFALACKATAIAVASNAHWAMRRQDAKENGALEIVVDREDEVPDCYSMKDARGRFFRSYFPGSCKIVAYRSDETSTMHFSTNVPRMFVSHESIAQTIYDDSHKRAMVKILNPLTLVSHTDLDAVGISLEKMEAMHKIRYCPRASVAATGRAIDYNSVYINLEKYCQEHAAAWFKLNTWRQLTINKGFRSDVQFKIDNILAVRPSGVNETTLFMVMDICGKGGRFYILLAYEQGNMHRFPCIQMCHVSKCNMIASFDELSDTLVVISQQRIHKSFALRYCGENLGFVRVPFKFLNSAKARHEINQFKDHLFLDAIALPRGRLALLEYMSNKIYLMTTYGAWIGSIDLMHVTIALFGRIRPRLYYFSHTGSLIVQIGCHIFSIKL